MTYARAHVIFGVFILHECAHQENDRTVLRTAAEISTKLIWQGNIRHPMTLQQLGRLLSAEGFEQRRLGHNGRRGYLVIENQRSMVADEALISDLRQENADNADNTF